MLIFAEFGNLSSLFLVAVALLVGLLLMRTNRYFVQSRSRWPQNSPPRETASPQSYTEKPSELARLEVEMHETAREFAAQLDTKMSALRALLAEADRAAARLEAALDKNGGHLPGPQADALWASTAPGDEGPGPAEAPLASEAVPRGRRYDEIYLLADYGFAPAEIAHRSGVPIGEVELILSLRCKGA